MSAVARASAPAATEGRARGHGGPRYFGHSPAAVTVAPSALAKQALE